MEFFAFSLIKRTSEFISADYNFTFLDDYNLPEIYNSSNNLSFARYFFLACNLLIVAYLLIEFVIFLTEMWNEKS